MAERLIKYAFFLNEEIARLPFEWRLLFVGLWTLADREGRLEDRPARIKAALFPYDERVDIEVGLMLLTDARLIARYEGNGTRVIAIPTWHKHQRPRKTEPASRLLAHDAGRADSHAPPPPSTPLFPTGTRSFQVLEKQDLEAPSKNTVSSTSTRRAQFERVWAAYPRKVGKAAACDVWQSIAPDEALTERILESIAAHNRSLQWQRDGGQFIPHFRTFLRQRRWEDEPAAGPPTNRAREPWTCPHVEPCNGRLMCSLATDLQRPRRPA